MGKSKVAFSFGLKPKSSAVSFSWRGWPLEWAGAWPGSAPAAPQSHAPFQGQGRPVVAGAHWSQGCGAGMTR